MFKRVVGRSCLDNQVVGSMLLCGVVSLANLVRKVSSFFDQAVPLRSTFSCTVGLVSSWCLQWALILSLSVMVHAFEKRCVLL